MADDGADWIRDEFARLRDRMDRERTECADQRHATANRMASAIASVALDVKEVETTMHKLSEDLAQQRGARWSLQWVIVTALGCITAACSIYTAIH